MKVVVYVEGPGDQLCLEALLRPLVEQKNDAGIRITFVPMTRGDRKNELLERAPEKAVNAILNNPENTVVILPDLYPQNRVFPHTTCAEMQAGVQRRFRQVVERKRDWDARIADRFQVFCLIHDLEVLLLAAEESLLADRNLSIATWEKPVEEQNHHVPPKRIVEKLFNNRYDSKVDGPRILEKADYRVVSKRCPAGFGRFVGFLEKL